MRKKRAKKPPKVLCYEELELRVLFSADIVPGLDNVAAHEQVLVEDVASHAQTESQAGEEAAQQTTSKTPQELVFVNENVAGYEQLIADLQGGDGNKDIEVVVLDSDRNGIEQVSEILSEHSNLTAVHFITHGADGQINLGNTWLDSTTLQQNSDAVAGWGKALTESGDILFYGCNIASDSGGQSLLNSIAELTGTDVAASDDATGHQNLGGDWELEFNAGAIETNAAFSPEAQQYWSGVLATFTVNTTADTADANPGDGLARDASGNTSLRAAIMEANDFGGADEIVLNAGTYKLSLGPSGDDHSAHGDLDVTRELTITGAGAAGTIIDGNGLDRVFHLKGNAANLTLTDLTVQGGSIGDKGGGIYLEDHEGQLTASRVIVTGNIADDGAGIFNEGTMTLTDVVISNNGDVSTKEGGGIHNKRTAVLNRVTISENQAVDGGGIHNDNGHHNLSLRNVTVSGNTASDEGGGLRTKKPVTIVNSTFTLNTADNGGGISNNGGTVNIRNTIVDGNSAITNPDIQGTFNSLGFNLIGDATGGNGFIGSDITGVGAQLGALANNGGFNETHALLAGSPAINAGTSAGAPAVDQRGYSRDALPDIGAYEFNAGSANHAPTLTSFAAPVDVTAEDTELEISLAEFKAQGDETDVDGTVDAFVVKAVSTGTLKIGATAGTATAWAASTNDTIDATNNAYWTPANNANGTINAFTAVAKDNDGAESAAPVQAEVNVTPVNDAPVGLPTITGTVTEDQTLTANTAGISDADGQGAFSYQWLRDGAAIGGATASNYVLDAADLGCQISVQVSYTDGHGTNESLTSAAVGPVVNVNEAPVGLPVITGNVTEDQTLTADTSGISDADGLGAFTYQWLRNGIAIGGATNSTYTLGDADVGTQISVRVSYTDGHGTNESLTSAQVGPVVNVNDAPVGLPMVTGTMTKGQTLAADTSGITDGDGLGALSYQWLRNGVTLGWATSSTYTLGSDDVHKLISVRVSYTDGHGTNESLTSAQVGPVANVNDAPVGVPTITGTATEDQTLTANTAGISDADGLGAFSYQWLRNGSAITGANASTYTLGDADVGTQISVRVSYTDGHGTNESLTSAQTPAVANVNDAPTGSVTIDNMTPAEGDTLMASNTLADADDLSGPISYQWQRDGVDIAGATGATYTTVQADVDKVITVVASYTDDQGTFESVTSAPTAAVTNVNNFPTGSVIISGTPTEDQTLTASNTLVDVDGVGSVSYRWQRNGVDIAGATGSNYVLGDADVGATISVLASYTDLHGTAESVTSAQTPAVANVNDAPVGVPSISGTVTEDQTLMANTGGISDADGLGTFSYQWLRNGVAIGGATNSTYTLGDADVGTQISVQVSYTDGHGTNESLTSAQVGPVVNVNDAPVGLPMITGTATEDQTLTAETSGISDADGLGAFSYQWLRDGEAIGGATASTYTQGDSDVGAQISVTVSYTDGHGTNENLTSAAVGPVANVNDAPIGVPVVTGTATEDQTLTLDVSGIADDDGLSAFIYRWLRNGANIAGATGSTYTLGDADVGAQISVTVTYTDGHGTVESVTSAQTAAVPNVNDLPVGLPMVTGTMTKGQTLAADTSGITDGDGLGALSYQWLRNGVTLGWATSSTYTLGSDDVHKLISVRVSYTDGHGTNESLTSAQVGPVVDVNEAPVGLPVITGNVTEDQTLTADTSGISDADGLGAFSYQWLRDGEIIAGATTSTYTLSDADVGTKISVQVSYTDGQGTAETLTSVQVGPVANVNDAPVGLPIITGKPVEDNTLTADVSDIRDADGLGAFSYQQLGNGAGLGSGPTSTSQGDTDDLRPFSYQWLRNGDEIKGATGRTYTLGDADVGAKISVQVSYTDGHGTKESLTSATVSPVVNVNDAPVGLPIITGKPIEDNTLTADVSGIRDADGLGAFSYQWLRDGVAIVGATNSTYTLGDADAGAEISVRVNYTDAHGTNENLTSARVGPVLTVNNSGPTVIDKPISVTPVTNPTTPNAVDSDSPKELAAPQIAPQDARALSAQTASSSITAGKATEQREIQRQEAPGENAPPTAATTTDFSASLLRKDTLTGTESSRAERPNPVQERDSSPEAPGSVMQTSDYEHLRDSLNAVKQEVTSESKVNTVYLGSAIVSSIGLSVGYVVWLLRGGMLLASLLSSAPAWQIVDPLPILGGKKDEDRPDDDESLESILDKKQQQTNPKHKTADASSDAGVKRQ